jgi:hypothetical protein
MRVQAALGNNKNPLSSQESHVVPTYCRILGNESEEKIAQIRVIAVDEGRGHPPRTINEIRAML